MATLSKLILLVIRSYQSYSLSYRDIEQITLERGISVDHSTINRWVIRYAPLLENEFRKNHKQKVGSSGRMNETYIKIIGVWHYLYRGIDKKGDTIDFMLSKKRDEAAAKAFFVKAIGSSGLPEKVTINKSGSNNAALNAINLQLIMFYLLGCTLLKIDIRQIKYLNNIVEQDHRGIRRITNPMMGCKALHSAESTLSGIELYRMLKKGQHATAFEPFYALAV
jgi:putative transposase